MHKTNSLSTQEYDTKLQCFQNFVIFSRITHSLVVCSLMLHFCDNENCIPWIKSSLSRANAGERQHVPVQNRLWHPMGPNAQGFTYKTPRPALGHWSPVFSTHQGSSLWVKRTGCEDDHAPPSIAEVKNEWS
jgi:hypothetical protein